MPELYDQDDDCCSGCCRDCLPPEDWDHFESLFYADDGLGFWRALGWVAAFWAIVLAALLTAEALT